MTQPTRIELVTKFASMAAHHELHIGKISVLEYYLVQSNIAKLRK